MDNMKCITFDKAAQDALPEDIKDRMASAHIIELMTEYHSIMVRKSSFLI